jgi:hypothetical protein
MDPPASMNSPASMYKTLAANIDLSVSIEQANMTESSKKYLFSSSLQYFSISVWDLIVIIMPSCPFQKVAGRGKGGKAPPGL